jgi:hypothetical protein
MKKIFLLLITLSFSTLALAQATKPKITYQDLQGNWKLIGFTVTGITVDVVKQTVLFSNELKSKTPAAELEKIKAGMMQSMGAFKTAHTTFEENRITQTMGEKVNKGLYALKEAGEAQFLFINDNGHEDDVKIYMENKQLHFIQADDDHPVNFVFVKQ